MSTLMELPDKGYRLRNLCHEVAAHGPKNWRDGLLKELFAEMTALAAMEEKAVGTVLGGEFHYLDVRHGLPDGTKLYAAPSSKTQDNPEVNELIQYFRNEGHRLGWQGDQYGWTPEQTAIKAMRELLRLHPMVALPQGDTKPHHAPPFPIDPAAVLALADEIEHQVEEIEEKPLGTYRGLRSSIKKLRALATGGQDGR